MQRLAYKVVVSVHSQQRSHNDPQTGLLIQIKADINPFSIGTSLTTYIYLCNFYRERRLMEQKERESERNMNEHSFSLAQVSF